MIDQIIIQPVVSVVKQVRALIEPIVNAVSTTVERFIAQVPQMQRELYGVDLSSPTATHQQQLILMKAFSAACGFTDRAQKYDAQLAKIQTYNKNDWLFLTGDLFGDGDYSPEISFAILDILKKNQGITAQDLIAMGLYSDGTRYNQFFFGFMKEDVAGNHAALLELSYRVTQQGETVYGLSLQEQQKRNTQAQQLLYFLGISTALDYTADYNASGGPYSNVPEPAFTQFKLGGTGNALTDGAKMSTNRALDAASDFLGSGYSEVAPGVFRSSDGLRQVRITTSDIVGAHGGGPHINFKTGSSIVNPIGRITFKVIENIHIYLINYK